MKPTTFVTLLSSVLLSSLPLSQAYKSEGWSPGQPVTKYLTSSTTPGAPAGQPTAYSGWSPKAQTGQGEQEGQEEVVVEKKPWTVKDLSNFGLEDILTSKGVSKFLERFGVNVTASLAKAREGTVPRFSTDIPLITDETYEEVIYNEVFADEKEEEERVWVVLCSVGAQDPVSTFYDKVFDEAYNLTLEAGDGKHVRWARVDYLDVTEITTRWVIWKAPVLVIAKDKGRELRFVKRSALKSLRDPEDMRAFIVDGEWEDITPWSGPWSPRGSRAPYLAKIAKWAAVVYTYLAIMPRWLLLLLTGTIASTAINFMHAGEEEKSKKERDAKLLQQANERREREEKEALENSGKENEVASKASAVKTGSSTPKKRKGGKK